MVLGEPGAAPGAWIEGLGQCRPRVGLNQEGSQLPEPAPHAAPPWPWLLFEFLASIGSAEAALASNKGRSPFPSQSYGRHVFISRQVSSINNGIETWSSLST